MKNPEQRKQESILKLKTKAIPYIDWLPHIESSDDVIQRSAEHIAKRAIACLLMIQVASDLDRDQFDQETEDFIVDLLNKFEVADELTVKEKNILNRSAAQQDIVNMIWKYEAYWVLLWALGIVDELKYPDEIADCDFAIEVVSRCRSLQEFMQQLKLRDIEEILDEADLIYRYDWACVDARLKQQNAPANLNASIVLERHGALNWLIQADADWDNPDVST
ncbi:hypothetical protein F892_00683 [Acinetobacter vivianii]|uniref:DUF4272 domain-containing protein n=1 Tax=Acinetobacter vivianii TaxID=1776742 RepID=N9Q4V3_9GAMM|nr:DUF4272 domain-containing protein [Acinetobacter vivianii]ENX21455.1 hypothetical protein F892_00683 [Acinetobacter vivianii]GGI61268.1 hypothetical protein GCM10011446_27630 [Acinetobacter vivianii]